MSQSSPLPARPVTLDQLVALNDEIASLARAGVPLEGGLRQLGQDMPGRLGKLAEAIGRRLEAGESLSQIVSQTDSSFPPIYQAVIEAGLRSGRLSVALEGLSTAARRVAELRRLIGVSLLYPLAVVTLAYLMFVFTATTLLPVLVENYRAFGYNVGWWLNGLVGLGETAGAWWPWPPILALVLLAIAWIRSGRFLPTAGNGLLGRLPSLGGLLRAGRMAAFAEVLAMLLEQQVPLDEAVVLAADASGDGVLQTSSRELAEQIRRGEPLGDGQIRLAGFPPMLRWLIASGTRQGELQIGLRHLAETYRARALRMSDWLLAYLPIILAAGIGGTATAILALTVVTPWFNLLYKLAQP